MIILCRHCGRRAQVYRADGVERLPDGTYMHVMVQDYDIEIVTSCNECKDKEETGETG